MNLERQFQAIRFMITALVALLAGCASVELAQSWKDPQFTTGPLHQVLVFGVSRSDTNRRVFEDQFSQSLKAAGIGAVQSYTLIQESGTIGNDRIKQAVLQTGADGVLVTRVQRVEKRVDVTPGYVGPAYGMGFYGWYGSAWASVPPTINQYDVLTLETTVWDMKTEKVVWSGTSKAFDPKDVQTLTAELSRVLIAKMRADGVL
jgi:hypothetical protein